MDNINLHGIVSVEISEEQNAKGTHYRVFKFLKEQIPGEPTQGIEIAYYGEDVPLFVKGKQMEPVDA